MTAVISVEGLTKTYATGFRALNSIDLEVREGEILALLGPNGAGKTTLISIICGIVNPSGGKVTVGGYDIIRDYRKSRSLVGLVPQEMPTDSFETPLDNCRYSRGLFGKPPDPAYLERLLRQLALWDKRSEMIMTLSGGMKRRLLIAKALSHEPRILFLDEPTAGVDVELRKDLWQLLRELRGNGATIILTTHYIEEAELMADRIAIINHGDLIVVEDKAALMRELGRKQLVLKLAEATDAVPPGLDAYDAIALESGGTELVYTYSTQGESTGITNLLRQFRESGLRFKDLSTRQRSLEDIFVELLREDRP